MSKLFCFLGPSGGGKSTIQHSLPKQIKFLIHYVTRELREGEIDGYHVKHCPREDFELGWSTGIIATRTEYAGNLYGAPRLAIHDIRDGIPYHATVTKESVEQFKKLLGEKNVIVIYIKPPDIDTLRSRMESRGDSKEDIDKRIANIFNTSELENENLADYVVMNDELEKAKYTVLGIIYYELYVKESRVIR